jgi:5'-methylthioadenosine phosphorylase
MPAERTCGCGHALRHAIITDRQAIPAEAKQKLRLILGKYLGE